MLNAMSQYLEKNNFKGMNVYSLNAAGKDFIGSDLNVKFSTHCEHYLMRNDLYIHYGCPKDWKIEAKVTFQTMGTNEQYVKPDARFFANDTWHYIEIDRTQSMVQNRSKIDQYAALSEIMKIKLNHKPMIIFYTTKESRQEK
ncbi:TPA: replication-relaxation family protein, partial [Listeria monocytogenes]|nr:replication-relaxation family protein [Listeria monocytogenes]